MKKSVIILIGVIYVCAIAVVSFFGLQFKVFNEIVPVEKIEILNEGLKTFDNGSEKYYYVVISTDENGECKYKIDYRVYPDNATDTKVSFSYDSQTNPHVTIDETGLVAFLKPGAVTVRIIAADGTNTEVILKIIAK